MSFEDATAPPVVAPPPRGRPQPQGLTPLRDIKVNCYHKKVTVRGCVVRVSRPFEMLQVMVFSCEGCKRVITKGSINGVFEKPKQSCEKCGKNRGKFLEDLTSHELRSVPTQIILIQEHFGGGGGGEEADNDGRSFGSLPRTLTVELGPDAVDACMPGDDVTITGLVKLQGTDNGKRMSKGKSSSSEQINSLYLEASSVVNKSRRENGLSCFDFKTVDLLKIRDVFATRNKLDLLVKSLCPDIFGHDMIKLGLLLSLFGGSSSGSRESVHVLLLGDPGLGKSQLLKACSRVAPKGIFVSGNSSTASGLTVTLVRDQGSSAAAAGGRGNFSLEPGALVLGDKGHCCIDEFDKMSNQHQALLEAMEQQTVSVSKCGINCTLPSRTSILAAANPLNGRYDRSKGLLRNLNMSPPLLSRFDLVFLLIDQADERLDALVSKRVMSSHTGVAPTRSSPYSIDPSREAEEEEDGAPDSLRKRLVSSSSSLLSSEDRAMSSCELRKYIAYARQYVNPTLSPASGEILKQFYLKLRKDAGSANNLAVCSRQLEASIRLTEARAKLDLREVTSDRDALDVIEILRCTALIEADFPDSSGTKAWPPQPVHARSSVLSLARRAREILKKRTKSERGATFSLRELKDIVASAGASEERVRSFEALGAIDHLNEQGILVKKDHDLYQFFD